MCSIPMSMTTSSIPMSVMLTETRIAHADIHRQNSAAALSAHLQICLNGKDKMPRARFSQFDHFEVLIVHPLEVSTVHSLEVSTVHHSEVSTVHHSEFAPVHPYFEVST